MANPRPATPEESALIEELNAIEQKLGVTEAEATRRTELRQQVAEIQASIEASRKDGPAA